MTCQITSKDKFLTIVFQRPLQNFLWTLRIFSRYVEGLLIIHARIFEIMEELQRLRQQEDVEEKRLLELKEKHSAKTLEKKEVEKTLRVIRRESGKVKGQIEALKEKIAERSVKAAALVKQIRMKQRCFDDEGNKIAFMVCMHKVFLLAESRIYLCERLQLEKEIFIW